MLAIVGSDRVGDFHFKDALEERGIPVRVVDNFDELYSLKEREKIILVIVHFFVDGVGDDGFKTSMPALRKLTIENPRIKRGVFVDSGVYIPEVIDFSINIIPLTCKHGYTSDERQQHFLNSITIIMGEILFDARVNR